MSVATPYGTQWFRDKCDSNMNSVLSLVSYEYETWSLLTLNLPTTNIVAQPFNVIKWQLKFNPVA